jgi:hypothetical protein
MTENTPDDDKISILANFFKRNDMHEDDANRLASEMIKIRSTLKPERIVKQFDKMGKKMFTQNILEDGFKITDVLDQNDIVDAIQNHLESPPVHYLLGCFDDGHTLQHATIEKEGMVECLCKQNLNATIIETNATNNKITALSEKLTDSNEYKVLHFAMHCCEDESGQRTIALSNHFNEYIDPDALCNTLIRHCSGPSVANNNGASILCIVLNVCNLSVFAKKLHDAKVKSVIYWKTNVHDEAAKTFSEIFYSHLVNDNSKTYEDFDDAYETAISHLKLRGWILVDPKDPNYVEALQAHYSTSKLRAAGIPRLHSQQKEKEDAKLTDDAKSKQNEGETIVPPEGYKIMISFNDESAGPDAEELAKRLTQNGHPTFCTRLYCRNNAGNWHHVTVKGVQDCKYYIPLMTKRWQQSNECQFETESILKRMAGRDVIIIPVYYECFDKDYDKNTTKQNPYSYKGLWSDLQSVYCNKYDDREKWMDAVSKLLPKDSEVTKVSLKNF